MEIRLTIQDVWLSTLLFGIVGCFLLLPLIFTYRNQPFQQSHWPFVLASTLFWGLLASFLVPRYWDLYYRYFYPEYIRPWVPLSALLYAGIGFIIWWLATRLPGSMVLWFVVFGATEGVLEHIIGIYAFGILEKVPWLQGITPLPVMIFSFFEYIVYWALVAWLAFGIYKLVNLIANS